MSDKHKISICFFNDREMRGNYANSNSKTQTPQLVSDINQLNIFNTISPPILPTARGNSKVRRSFEG